MAWKLKGSYIETCSCDLICPCNATFDHGATYDYCRVTLVFNIREGEIEGTDIGGLKIAAIADTPKVMTEGNWKLGVFVDENATEEQADKLVKVFTGQLGGPMAGLAPLVGEMRMPMSPSFCTSMSMWSRRAPSTVISPPAMPHAAR